MRVLLTGATGFLGSHIAEVLLKSEVDLMMTKRTSSSLKNCISFVDRVRIINSDDSNWISEACSFCPNIIIHAAWSGVVSSNRDNWLAQLSNIDFVNTLLYIAEKSNVSKFIALGSQAEYGEFSGIVSEDTDLSPVNGYGYVKSMTYKMVSTFCDLNSIDWYWLRVFSVFGERESSEWMITKVISNIISNKGGMDLTLGEQKYAYLYVKDFANAVAKVCLQSGSGGVYNISSSTAIKIKTLVEYLKDKLNPDFELRFGTLPYRIGQPMLMQGDVSKFIKTFGSFEMTSLNVGLDHLITYCKEKYEII